MTQLNESDGVKKVFIDDILLKFGSFGRYHVILGICLSILDMLGGATLANYVFVAEKVDFRCKPLTVCNVTTSIVTTSIVNRLNYTSVEDQCYERVSVDNGTSCTYDDELVPCREWQYDDPHSFVAEVGCEDWKLTLVGTMHMAGYTVGLVIIGVLADRFGRKPLLVTTTIFGGIIGTIRSFSGNYTTYVALEFWDGAFGDSYATLYVLFLEAVTAKYRVLYAAILGAVSSTSHLLLACLAWYFQNWRFLLRAIYIPHIVIFLFAFYIDESPRWLLTKKRKDSAVAILKKAAKMSNIVLNKSEIDNLTSENKEDMKFIDTVKTIFKSRILLKRFLICVVLWIVACYHHYGVLVNSVLLSGNKYINYILVALSKIPTSVLLYFLMEKHRRKMPLFYGLLGAAVCFGVQPFVPESANFSWLSISMFIVGQALTNMCFGIIYIFTLELFPTDTRSSMLSLCSSLGRIGSILGPQTPLLIKYWPGLPSLTFAAASFIAAGLTLLVPDGDVEALPDTVTQAERVGNRCVTGQHDAGERAGNRCVTGELDVSASLPDSVTQAELAAACKA